MLIAITLASTLTQTKKEKSIFSPHEQYTIRRTKKWKIPHAHTHTHTHYYYLKITPNIKLKWINALDFETLVNLHLKYSDIVMFV